MEIPPSPQLEHIDIEITKDCNLNCPHCSSGKRKKGTELETKEIKKIVSSAQKLGLKRLGFTGGEPFFNFTKLRELLDFSSEQKLPVHIHSNGTLIDSEKVKIIKKNDVKLTTSLYGANKEVHEKITGMPGSFNDTINGIKNLIKNDVIPTVYFVPMKSNYVELYRLAELVKKLGGNKIRLLSLSPTGRALDDFDKLSLSNTEIINLSESIEKIKNEIPVEIVAGFCTRITYPELSYLDEHDSCYSAQNRVHIDAFGNVFPCTAASGVPTLSAGNVKSFNFNLKSIWVDSPYFQLLRGFHKNRPTKCLGCSIYEKCMSGCRVVTYYKYNDISLADDCPRTPKK
jgi:radical SAM protein with 4Fe4S-binding SPASM domain